MLSTVFCEVHFTASGRGHAVGRKGWHLQQGLRQSERVCVFACKCVAVDLSGVPVVSSYGEIRASIQYGCASEWSIKEINAYKNELR